MLPPPAGEKLPRGRGPHCRPVDQDDARRRERLLLALLVAGTVLFFTREAVLVPFTVGWPAARMLVQSEKELATLRAQAAEYRSAAGYFGTPAGRDYARKLIYNQQEPGEKRLDVEAVPESRRASLGRWMQSWWQGTEKDLDTSQRQTRRVIGRLFVDPPAYPRSGSAGPTPVAPQVPGAPGTTR